MKKIRLWGVKQNNLKGIDVEIPIGSLTVVCGPSGSGKSSLAFETLYAEGQRRYIESLSTYARQFLGKAPKPDVDGIENIPPAIAIEQKNSVKNSRSTVGTSTEVVDYLRLLFEKVGQNHCPTYGFAIQKESVTDATRITLEQFSGQRGYILAPVFANQRTKGKSARAQLHEALVKEGFLRIYIPKEAKNAAEPKAGEPACRPPNEKRTMGEVIELKTAATGSKEIPDRDFYVVVDRMAFSKDDEGRLADSLSQAYRLSVVFNPDLAGGRATVLTTDGSELAFSEENSCAVCGFTFPAINSQLFSFNNPIGACSTCHGFGNILSLDENKVIPNPALSVAEGALHPFTMPSAASDKKLLLSWCKKRGIDIHRPYKDLNREEKDLLWKGDKNFFGVVGLFDYLETKKYKMHVRVFLSRYKSPFTCSSCLGTRLRPEVRYIQVGGHTFQKLSQMTIGELYQVMLALKLSPQEQETAQEILDQIRARLRFLNDVGVEYLTLDRPTKTLSGGEFQRLNLAKQLGMGLSQTLYVLDEPTVGLHPRDNDRLIGILKRLNALGNTLVIVEHDRDVIESSSNVIEMGPGSGHLGGRVVFSGPTREFYQSKDSVTVPYLRGRAHDWESFSPRPVDLDSFRFCLELTGCRGHNLKNLNVKFPLNRLVVVTGVSGSGKSTLVTQTLYPAVAQALKVDYRQIQPYDKMKGVEQIQNVLLVDQSPIGRTARSNPVTYLGVYDAIRSIFAATAESKTRGYTTGTFSLNVDGGRCPVCKGLGFELIDMMFMDDVQLTCEACDGRKFRREILEVTYRGKSISDVLNLTVNEALEFFVAHPNIRKPLSFLKEVGLDYIRLGQSSNTFSGGESQRLKIARELVNSQQKATLYIMDEPTTGLHFREIEMLMRVLHRLVDAGASVILIEHNLEVIRAADYIIDIGPEAGAKGGRVVVQGPPEAVMREPRSLTGQYLDAYCKGSTQRSKAETEAATQ